MTPATARCLVVFAALTMWAAAPVRGRQATPAPAGETWSATVDGLRGRLILTPSNANGRVDVRIDLELQNMRDGAEPLDLAWGTVGEEQLEFSVETEGGTPLQGAKPGGNRGTLSPYWLSLPSGSTLRVLITAAAYEYVAPGRTLFRPLTFVGWTLPAAGTPNVPKYYVRATLRPFHAPDASRRPWTGALSLPRLPLPPPTNVGG